MNRIAGIVGAALGVIIAVLGIVKIVPGGTPLGLFMVVGGLLVIGLSFVKRPESDGSERMSTGATLANIFISPTEVFSNFRRHPRFLVAMMIAVLLSSVYANLFISRLGSDAITNYTIDKTLETPFVANNEQAKAQIEAGRGQAIIDAKDPIRRGLQVGASFVGLLVVSTIGAVVLMLFALAMGGQINLFQAFSVVVYAGFPVKVITTCLNTLLLYIKEPSDIHPILGQQTLIIDSLNFLVKSGEHPIIYTLLGSLSIFSFYWVWLLATGLKNAGEKVTGTIAWSGAIGVYSLLVLLGLAMAALFPSFIS